MKAIRYCLLFLAFTLHLSAFSENKAKEQLQKIHSKLILKYGLFSEEYPEQLMSVMFLKKRDRVLELGGNIGRNSLVIGSILKNSNQLVVLETDPSSAAQLTHNRDLNKLTFKIEDAALSKVPLVQSGWTTMPSDTVPPGFYRVKTISYADLKKKHKINFNVLVADCEGALYYIFRDDETLLSDIELIIVENDYIERFHYEEVKKKFLAHGFSLIYTKAGGWGPCSAEFYQVWKKSL